jgi:EF hand
MNENRPSKKSESIEVRLPFEAKQAFIAACKAERRTASDVIRGAIEAYVEGRGDRRRLPAERKLVGLVPPALRRKRYIALGAASVLGIAALAAMPSAAAPGAPDKVAAFAKLDRNGDGFVSYEEFVAK